MAVIDWTARAQQFLDQKAARAKSANTDSELRLAIMDTHGVLESTLRGYLSNVQHVEGIFDKSSKSFPDIVQILREKTRDSVINAREAELLLAFNRLRNNVIHEEYTPTLNEAQSGLVFAIETIHRLVGDVPVRNPIGKVEPVRPVSSPTPVTPASSRKPARPWGKVFSFLILIACLCGMAGIVYLYDSPGSTSEVTETHEPVSTPVPDEHPSTLPENTNIQPAALQGTDATCVIVWVEYTSEKLAAKNRSMVWEEIVMDQVRGSGMTDRQFYDQVVERNPQLKADGYEFKKGKTYLLPECE
jgi:hypothetical protein